MKTLLIILFLSVNCSAQQSINVESRWEYDFETANRIPDTVYSYDFNTSYPVPWYRIVKDSLTCGVMRSPTGKQYFLYKYKVFLLDVKTEKTNGRR